MKGWRGEEVEGGSGGEGERFGGGALEGVEGCTGSVVEGWKGGKGLKWSSRVVERVVEFWDHIQKSSTPDLIILCVEGWRGVPLQHPNTT